MVANIVEFKHSKSIQNQIADLLKFHWNYINSMPNFEGKNDVNWFMINAVKADELK